MASSTTGSHPSKNDGDIQIDENNLNISMESDHLDPEQKAAHDADTLPMDGPQAPVTKPNDKWSVMSKRCKGYLSPILAKDHDLAPNSSALEKIKYACFCPPHGKIGRILTYAVLVLGLWGSCLSMFGDIAAPPDGTIFWLIILVIIAMIFGWVFSLARLPPLLGMLVAGIIIKNIPGVRFDDNWDNYSSTLRSVALVVILMRAGLGLDPAALKRLSGMVIRLAFTPCLVETIIVGISSRILFKYALQYEFPWLWGFLLGFVLAAVSPAVVVPSLLELQEKGYGVSKGIPTLVIAAASVDDVLAISGFSILLGLAFQGGIFPVASHSVGTLSTPTVTGISEIVNTTNSSNYELPSCEDEQGCNGNVAIAVFQGIGTAIKEALVGVLGGIFWGLLCIVVPNKKSENVVFFRTTILMFGGFLALFGSKHEAVDLPGSGALAVLVMAFVAGVGWRKYSRWEQDNSVTDILGKAWMIFQPILFVLIGTEIRVDKLEVTTVSIGVAVLCIGLVFRIVASYLAVGCGDLTPKERVFVALAWLPKATVQAAVGGQALDDAKRLVVKDGMSMEDIEHYQDLGLKVLIIAVLAILITAPIGAIAIKLSAPSFLKCSSDTQKDKDGEAGMSDGE